MKKKQASKIIVMALSAMMALSALAGCANNNVDAVQPTAQPTAQAESNAKDQQAGSDAEVPVIDIGLRAGVSWVQKCPDINTDEHVLAFEEKMGVDLNISLIQHDGFTEKLGMMLAQGDFPDVISGDLPYTSVMSGAIENGLFLPLDDLLAEYAPNMMEQVPEAVWDELRGEDGHIYGIGDFISNPARRCTVIRKDLLDKLESGYSGNT